MKQTNLTLVVLAAGIGSRYDGLKQMDPMGPSGEIIMDYSIYDALAAGFSRIVFVISKAIEMAERFPRFLAENRANIEKAEFFIPNVVADLIREQRARVKVLATAEKWHGVTYAQDKPQVKAALGTLVEAGVYPARLWKDAV